MLKDAACVVAAFVAGHSTRPEGGAPGCVYRTSGGLLANRLQLHHQQNEGRNPLGEASLGPLPGPAAAAAADTTTVSAAVYCQHQQFVREIVQPGKTKPGPETVHVPQGEHSVH